MYREVLGLDDDRAVLQRKRDVPRREISLQALLQELRPDDSDPMKSFFKTIDRLCLVEDAAKAEREQIAREAEEERNGRAIEAQEPFYEQRAQRAALHRSHIGNQSSADTIFAAAVSKEERS